MSVRAILILLALPLFLLLAAVNSLLLYREESRDMEAGLRGEAIAAAVTVAEFARETPDPFTGLAQPHRLAALRASTGNIPGLEALYLIEAGRPPLSLLDRPIESPRIIAVPDRPQIVDSWRDKEARPLISAIAPAGRGAMVVADIDAEPLARKTFHLKRLSIALVGGSATLAILLGLFIGRRVSREFRLTRAIIAAQGGSKDHREALSIREVRDLADAVELIDTSVTDELARLVGKKLIDADSGIAALRARHFPDIIDNHAGVTLSIRTLSGAAPGSFHVHQRCESGFRVALGEVGGEPAQALACAVALRDFVAAGSAQDFEQRLALASHAFGVTHAIDMASARDGLCALHDPQRAMPDYAARNPGLDPEALTSDLAMLFPDAGIIVALKSAQRA